MTDFLFRLKVSAALIWLNACAYADPKVRRFAWGWLRNGMRDPVAQEPERLLLLLGFRQLRYARLRVLRRYVARILDRQPRISGEIT